LLDAVRTPDTDGQLTIVPEPMVFSQEDVEKVRNCVKTNVSPEPSARRIGTIAWCGSDTPRLSSAIGCSSQALIFPE
jgi:hypothetical protein